jgi:hypothetical protein
MDETTRPPEPASDRPEPTADRSANAAPFLSPERLDVYRVAVEFQKAAVRISWNRRVGVTLRDQVDRASVSIVLCIAEGAGRGAFAGRPESAAGRGSGHPPDRSAFAIDARTAHGRTCAWP